MVPLPAFRAELARGLREARPHGHSRVGDPSSQLLERHDASDFDKVPKPE